MRITLVLLATAALSVQAATNVYTLQFTGANPAPTGGFIYDDSAKVFKNFIVRYQGINFDLTASANANRPLTGCTGSGAAPAFSI